MVDEGSARGVSDESGLGGLLALWFFSFGAAKFRHGPPALVAVLLACVVVSASYCLFWLYRRWRFGGFSDRAEGETEEKAAGAKGSLWDSWQFEVLLLAYLLVTLNGYRDDIWVFLLYAPLPLLLASSLLRKAFTASRRGSG
ncbi:hypothetical protein ACFYY8_27345 [Streptosporangium sp. NPDC001559]|uniref:hypothetical protein n=1 Tax=Streptosporangium sp. NPDC001559 TaxID=3366187 RepID=UPI0036EC1267